MAVSKETCTVLVTNLPNNSTKEDVASVFEDVGPVKKCIIITDKKNPEVCSGTGYVTFAVREDAEAAVSQPVTINGAKVDLKLHERGSKVHRTGKSKDDVLAKRDLKQRWKSKKPRLIIRNLSFKVGENDLRKECAIYGELTEVSIPQSSDGRKRGFAFIQFKNTKSAIKAIKSLNLKKLCGRPIAVDFALPKDKYEEDKGNNKPPIKVPSESSESESESDEETNANPDADITTSEDEAVVESDDKKKPGPEELSSDESVEHDNSQDIVKDADSRWFDLDSDDESRSSDSDLHDEHDEDPSSGDSEKGYTSDDQSNSEAEEDQISSKEKFKAKRKSQQNDGRTLFVRNLPFMSDEESFKECMEQFGEVFYALLCLDRETEHPKGTGFVRFKTVESTQECLKAADGNSETGLILDGRRIYVELAISKDEVVEKLKNKNSKKESKDKRNLYLAREGLIREGSLAAQGVSKIDLAKRVQLEMKKKRMLRNLHFFVSRTRLVIQNLPPYIDDKGLRKMFLEAANSQNCKITEAKVMRNLKQVDSQGQSPSKGFGFVSFTEHEHALAALRSLNNNPNTFQPKKRPIVEFSIENMSVLNAKKRKEEYNQKVRTGLITPPSAAVNTKSKGYGNNITKSTNQKEVSRDHGEVSNQSDVSKKENFSGFASEKGIKGLPSHRGPKVRNKKRSKSAKQNNSSKPVSKHDTAKETSQLTETKESRKRKAPSKKQVKETHEEASFQKLVKKYKKTIVDGQHSIKEKWFDDGV